MEMMFEKLSITAEDDGVFLVELDDDDPVYVAVDDNLLSPLVASVVFIVASIIESGGSTIEYGDSE